MSDATSTTPADTPAPAGQDASTQQGAAGAEVQTDSTQTGQDTTQTGKAEEKPAAQAEGDQKQGDQAGKDGEGDKPAGAPETYADFELPEGFVLDSEDSDAIKAYAKENNLSQESAQKLVTDLGVKQAAKFAAKLQEAQEARNTEWANASKADKEFGGDKLPKNLAVAKTFLDEHGTPELKKFLVDSGLGNHPEMIRLMFRAGKAISEDTAVQGGNPATTGSVNPATALYGKSSSK